MACGPEIVLLAAGERRRLGWCAEHREPPSIARVIDDHTRADVALRHALAGEGLLWQGDWHNARQTLAAMARRIRPVRPRGQGGPAALFLAERETRRRESELLSHLLVPVEPGWRCPLPRAPALGPALEEAFGPGPDQLSAIPLRDVLGAIGAHEWFRRGVLVPALGGTLHPRYGVFAPIRSEYVDLFAATVAARAATLRLTEGKVAFDVGTGTGVLAVLLARAGARVIATDVDPRAVRCARETAVRFGVERQVEVLERDLHPPGRARLVVTNPPWIPGEAHGPLDRAVYDPGGATMARAIAGLPDHLEPGGEAWLLVSDLAERLGLRPPGAIEAMAGQAGLCVASTASTAAAHPRAKESRESARRGTADAVARARAAEVTRLLVLVTA